MSIIHRPAISYLLVAFLLFLSPEPTPTLPPLPALFWCGSVLGKVRLVRGPRIVDRGPLIKDSRLVAPSRRLIHYTLSFGIPRQPFNGPVVGNSDNCQS